MQQKLILLEKPSKEHLAILSENNLNPETKCISCGETALELVKDTIYSIEDCTFVEHGFLCGGCRESDGNDPVLTIMTNDEDLDNSDYGLEADEGLLRIPVGQYINNTGDAFRAEWKATGGWRGYYEVIAKGWVKFHSDCILAYSEDSKELEDFDDEIERYFREKNVRFAKVFSRTSNVCSQGYDFFVKKEDFKTAEEVRDALAQVNKLKEKFRDEERFLRTSITGSSKETKEGKLLVKAHKLIEEGKDFEDVKDEIMGEV